MKRISNCGIVMCVASLLCAICTQPGAQQAQSFPVKPIRFIIPTAAGGGSDQIVRHLGNRYTAVWGQQVVADNRPGAGMTIGIDITAKATPDGHTMALVNPSHAINATLMKRLPYHPINDLTPVSVYNPVTGGTVTAYNLASAKASASDLLDRDRKSVV